MKYIQPNAFEGYYTCPNCGTLAKQNWWGSNWDGSRSGVLQNNQICVGRCQACWEYSLWIEGKMLYPDTGNAPFPNPEMPKSVSKLYQEAASIKSKSPRGAAALLRLAIQHLCKELGESGKNINSDIGNLVKKGLPVRVQKSLDIVRVTGNNAVHPGQIDTDDPNIVQQLFLLINVIVEYMIEMPKQIDTIYGNLPSDSKKGIEVRDKKNSSDGSQS